MIKLVKLYQIMKISEIKISTMLLDLKILEVALLKMNLILESEAFVLRRCLKKVIDKNTIYYIS